RGRLQRAVTGIDDPSTNAGRVDGRLDRPAGPRSAGVADLASAVEIAAAAGVVLMDRYERLERIDHKGARDVVTEADHLSEELFIAAIRARFPGDAILAEESGAHAAPESRPVNRRTWVIDPLDGT